MLRSTLVVLAALLMWPAFSQSSSERAAVRLTATVQASPATITLNWATIASTTSLTIYRKTKMATSWGSAIATPAASALQWADNTAVVGTNYEYRIVRVSAGITGTGYVSTGIQVPVTDYRGKMILLVDNTLAPQMVTELNQLVYDLRADGWAVLRSDVSRTASVTSIKSIVQTHYNSDPANVKALYLIGHVPVPYSGDITPDGHDDGKGARPTDGYYADVNGTWTDNTVNTSIGGHPQSWNTPGDGKFDQSDFPSALELQVGRVDMYDMPAFTSTEVQLVRNYLNKAHSYKMKWWAPTVRNLMIDNLQWVGNPIAGSGWRLAPLTGGTSPVPTAPILTFADYVNGQSYLWTCHYGGGQQSLDGTVITYSGTDGGATTQQLATTVTMGGVFNMAMGSFFYDFDNRNNFLRAIIARGDALTNVWSGIPAWYFHHMGMGDNIGYSVLQSMNNTSLYTPLTEGWQATIGRTHMNLMGDPSLRMKMVTPPTNLAVANSSGYAAFTWTASSESVTGYHIYQIDASTGLVTRLTTNPITTTNYTNAAIPFVAGREYMVRAVALETNYSGSFYNLSLGSIATAAGTATVDCLGVVGGTATVGSSCNDNDPCTTGDVRNASCQCVGTSITPTATITAASATTFCTGGSVVLNATTGTGYTYGWRLNGTAISGATGSSYTATQTGSYIVTVTVGGCSTASAGVSVTVTSAPTATITAASATTFCSGGSVVLNGSTGTGYTYVWKRGGTAVSGATSSSYTASVAGSYTLTVSSGSCSTTSSGTTVTVNTTGTATITAASSTGLCTGGSVVLNGNTGTGNTYVWKRGGTAISGATSSSYTASIAGSYTLAVTNGTCSATSTATTVTVSAAPTATITAAGAITFCSGGAVTLNSNTGTGYTYAWKRGGTAISGATGSAYSASVAGSYTCVVSSGGCSTTSSAITVTVNTTPAATITAATTTSFCSGGSVALSTGTGTGYTYAWKLNGTAIANATGSSYTASQGGSYTVTVSNGSCVATSTGTTVTVTPVPSAVITLGGPPSICSSGSVPLNANTGTGFTYTWFRNNVAIVGATGSSYSATLAGDYTVTVTNNGCSKGSSLVTVSVTAGPTLTCSSNAATSSVSVAATGGLAPYTYSWNTVPVKTTATATVTTSGNYTATVTDARGCISTCTSSITLTPVNNCAGIRTESQSTWGATASGTNPAAYMVSHFVSAFPSPNYLTIGCGTRTLMLTSASAVTAFLPSTGTPARLATGTLQNPGTTYSNSLAGQLVALKLSVRFDELSTSFSPSSVLLKNMIIASGTFAGWTVQQLMDAADSKLGSCGGNYTRATLNTAITAVNDGYAGGTISSGYLQCPGSSGLVLQDDPIEENLGTFGSLDGLLKVDVFPNPVNTTATIVIEGMTKTQPTTIDIYTLSGVLVEQRQLGILPTDIPYRTKWNVEGRGAGVYLYRVLSGDRIATGKILVE